MQVRCLRPREGKEFSRVHTAAKRIEGSGLAWLHHETPPCATGGRNWKLLPTLISSSFQVSPRWVVPDDAP